MHANQAASSTQQIDIPQRAVSVRTGTTLDLSFPSFPMASSNVWTIRVVRATTADVVLQVTGSLEQLEQLCRHHAGPGRLVTYTDNGADHRLWITNCEWTRGSRVCYSAGGAKHEDTLPVWHRGCCNHAWGSSCHCMCHCMCSFSAFCECWLVQGCRPTPCWHTLCPPSQITAGAQARAA